MADADLRQHLLPCVVPPMGNDFKDVAPGRPLLPGIFEVRLVIDHDIMMTYLNGDQLAEAGLSLDQAFAAAMENLRARSRPPKWVEIPDAPGLQVWGIGDAYESSRMLLLPELVSPWPAGGVIVAVPTRETLIVLRVDRRGSLDLVDRFPHGIENAQQGGGHRLADLPYWHDGQTWEPVTIKKGWLGQKTELPPRLRSIAGQLP